MVVGHHGKVIISYKSYMYSEVLIVRVFFSDGELLKHGGKLRLVKLDNHWHVSGHGFLCVVRSYKEGIHLIEKIRSDRSTRGVSIERAPETAGSN
jgi:hypothetical protein